MLKKYSDYMNEITPDELYDRLIQYGLFSEKLPPIFDCSEFLSFCKTRKQQSFTKQWYPYAVFEHMRNINIPRIIGIPAPMAHERLCSCLKNNWSDIQNHFKRTTLDNKHIISRIHIRKMKDTDSLFKMNYDNWRKDGSPEIDISLGKNYLIKADISKCFPSIYSHAIPWAIASKSIAKTNIKSKEWYNNLDEEVRNSTNGETHGILIGPHTSNLLSEIILCKIDEELSDKWDYIRNIDDYSCYVNSKDEADEFLIDLNRCLRKYDLSLNHKKTEILKLPIAAVEQWTRQLQDKAVYLEKFHPYVDYHETQAFIDYCIDLMAKNKENTSILYYGIKLLQGHKLTKNASSYIAKMITSLALNYPYIVPILDKYVYESFQTPQDDINKYLNLIYNKYISKNYFEAVSHALYLAVKYNIKIRNFDVNTIILKEDCVLSLCAYIYCKHYNIQDSLTSLKEYAKSIKDGDSFIEQWPFAYECLTVGCLSDSWKTLKNNNISFLKKEYR